MIKPTVGRVVLFRDHSNPDDDRTLNQPMAAMITFVHSDRLVNLTVWDHSGNQRAETSVDLLQPEDEVGVVQRYAEWMPYQKGQAAKTEALEQKVAGNLPGSAA